MFKSQKEKHAYKQGIKKGRKGGKVWYSRKKPKKKKIQTPKKGVYNMSGRVNENRVDDLHGPVVFWDGNFD